MIIIIIKVFHNGVVLIYKGKLQCANSESFNFTNLLNRI